MTTDKRITAAGVREISDKGDNFKHGVWLVPASFMSALATQMEADEERLKGRVLVPVDVARRLKGYAASCVGIPGGGIDEDTYEDFAFLRDALSAIDEEAERRG